MCELVISFQMYIHVYLTIHERMTDFKLCSQIKMISTSMKMTEQYQINSKTQFFKKEISLMRNKLFSISSHRFLSTSVLKYQKSKSNRQYINQINDISYYYQTLKFVMKQKPEVGAKVIRVTQEHTSALRGPSQCETRGFQRFSSSW